MSDPDASAVAVALARALERAGVPFAVGGSLASSSHGEPRASRDIDVAVWLSEADVPRLVAALGPDFDVDEAMLREAARTRRSANVFYLPTFMKIVLFVRGDTEYDRAELARVTRIEPVSGEEVPASSIEDNLLWKLRWFRMGGEVSDLQWRDVLGILRVSGARLDLAYTRRWARSLGVEDLLGRALSQAAMPG